MSSYKILFVHHFPLHSVTGVTVMVKELLSQIPKLAPNIQVGYRHFHEADCPDSMGQLLEEKDRDACCVIGINLQIEVKWEWSLMLAKWCQRHAIPLYNNVQDYWPQHESSMKHLSEQFNVRLISASHLITDQLARDNFTSEFLPMGVQLLQGDPPSLLPSPRKITSIGRITRRKLFPDIVKAFRLANLKDQAELHLTLIQSQVFSSNQDEEQLNLVQAELDIAKKAGCKIFVRTTPDVPPDFTPFAAYVRTSDYEGFSMPPYEAAYSGCPPIVSDIPPHRHMAESLFEEHAEDFLFPVSKPEILATCLKDEIETGKRRRYLLDNFEKIRKTIEEGYSLRNTAQKFIELCQRSK